MIVGRSTCSICRQFPGGAGGDTLAAGDAGHIAQGLLKHAPDMGVEATAVGADDSHMLVGTGSHAAAAENTFGVVADQMQGAGIIRSIRGGWV